MVSGHKSPIYLPTSRPLLKNTSILEARGIRARRWDIVADSGFPQLGVLAAGEARPYNRQHCALETGTINSGARAPKFPLGSRSEVPAKKFSFCPSAELNKKTNTRASNER